MPDKTIVILGASGDLTRRLLFPALHRLLSLGRVRNVRLVGFAVEDWTTAEFLEHLHAGVMTFGDGVDETAWATLVVNASYVRGELTPKSLKALAPLVVGDAVFYLALPPGLFGQAAAALGEAGLADEVSGARRLVIEKPFGTSSATAVELQSKLAASWREDQIFRIDHFLGKDAVQNMLVFRLANRFVEAVWNSSNIAQVQITAAETIGLEGRWKYYDQAGALRDMLQNHLMQLFALCAMEPPSHWDAEVLRNHKVEVLHSVRPMTPADVASRSVRGQYASGSVGEASIVAYRDEPNIDPHSNTETYAALQLFVDNWRWQGVPFSLRSGKRMSGDVTEIALQLRPPPSAMIHAPATSVSATGIGGTDDNGSWIVLRLRPDETIELDAVTKKAGLGLDTRRVTLTTTDPSAGGSPYTAYEQLLLDVLAGDRSLFIRGDEAMAAWAIVQPVLDAWKASGEPLPYRAGSDGPDAPPGFFAPDQRWRPTGNNPTQQEDA